MSKEKFNIKIERNLLRLNNKGKITNLEYPKVFGNKEKNDFIKTDTKDYMLILKTPLCKNVQEAFSKLEEITNVVYVELYNLKEIVWPFSNFEDMDLTSKITLSIDKEYYKEIKKVNNNLPEKFEDAYKNVKEQFNNKVHLIENLFGKCTLKIKKDNIEISNIRNNYLSRNAITIEEIYFLVALIFSIFEKNSNYENLSEEIKNLNRINKMYSLKATEAIKKISNELKVSNLDKESKMTLDEKINFAKEYMEKGYETRYSIQNYSKLVAESVAIIKDAISQGIDYNILNEQKSIVEFKQKNHAEFVIEGNKTDRDNYIFPIITDDKFISKQIMHNYGLKVPKAILLEKNMSKEEIEDAIHGFYNQKLVVKPRNTNYGTGITVFAKKTSKANILNAIEYAFRFDNNVLIEEYAKGMEYRFLVVNGKCLSVAHRRVASVVGDGKSTIEELIDSKNNEPWHKLTGTPVKKDDAVVEFLKTQEYDYKSIIPAGKRVFLRTNSNCSTGGEAIDMTNVIPSKFKKIAEKASRAFDAKICGVDIIIDDLESDEYAIIEINDNPGYSINEWPYEGNGERIGLSILKLLDFDLQAK